MLHMSSMADRVILQPDGRRGAVLDVIESAQTRLALSVYRLDDAEVFAALGRARRRGVVVEALVTDRVKGSRDALDVLVAALEAAGLAVRRYLALRKYHAKYIVADDRLAFVGSMNFTRKCFDETCDFGVLTRDREAIGGLTRLFEVDYHGARNDGDFGRRLIVGPERARTAYAALLGQARRSLRLVDHKLTDTEMLSIIRARAAAGVAVEILGRDDVGALVPHGKLAIVDARVAAIGSIALSARSLDRRRELAILVTDRPAVETLHEYFEGLSPAVAARCGVRRTGKWTERKAV